MNLFFFFFNDTATTEIYTLSLHDALPISMTLRFVICDDFGVDQHDLYSPGLISFWVLQHERSGYRPFINELVVESTFSDRDRKSTRLNSSHANISYAVFCLKKNTKNTLTP